jgi:hypothetical protein
MMEIYDKNFKKIKNIKIGGKNEEFEDYSEDDDNKIQIASKYGGSYVNEMFGGEEDDEDEEEDSSDEDSDEDGDEDDEDGDEDDGDEEGDEDGDEDGDGDGLIPINES